jgi:hypothetical protein
MVDDIIPRRTYTIQALVLGIGWVTFDVVHHQADAEAAEHRACHADDQRYPGKSPRRTRILVDGQAVPTPSDKPKPLEIFS